MRATTFSIKEKEDIRKIFGKPLEELDLETFKKIHRELRSRYHPDNFEHLDNEAVKEMATEKFQTIEALSEKIEAWLTNSQPAGSGYQTNVSDYLRPEAVFAIKRLKIEILTSDKDLKYHLFGTHYRWLQFGDSFKIPNTKASIVIDEDYAGRRIGFQESVRMYLTFGEGDSIEDMADWLFGKIQGRATSLLIAGNSVKVEPFEIVNAIKKESYLRIGPPVAS
ncbi:MAG: J domain-containing protein [Saprospiraceae bacterium]